MVKRNSIEIKIEIVLTILMIGLIASFPLAQEGSTLRNYQLNRGVVPFKIHTIFSDNKFEDLDHDGDPDVLYSKLENGMSCLWIDDDDDMKISDLQGDLDSDCLVIDMNGDGNYGGELDLNIDYIDPDKDQKADIQLIVDNGKKDFHGKWESHFLVFFDDDKDGVFSYMDAQTLKFEGWDHSGLANFFADYHGKSKMLKVHITTSDIQNLEYNWENPFLWYDYDNDGLTEMAIRVVDEPISLKPDHGNPYYWGFSKTASLVQQTWDLDNDSAPGNELDFDLSLKFMGQGFDYSDQIHYIGQNPTQPRTDKFFQDPRWRHLDRFIFPDHEMTPTLVHERGNWQHCWLVFDEDDDCQRWERVEFYDPLSPFKFGAKNGGIDNNPQADVSGDRGEWDADFSGKGNLYISPLDGKIHLYGAELGYWRIDQNATYFQGWQGWRGPNLQPEDFATVEPQKAATIKYEDTDNNGYFDKMSFDMDGDTIFEEVISTEVLHINDESPVFHSNQASYKKMQKLFKASTEKMWKNALNSLKVAEKYHLNTNWYSNFLHPKSLQEKYHNGFWLGYFVYRDLMQYAEYKSDSALKTEFQKAYFSSSWKTFNSF
ncbi:MAG: hypothetical protein H6567_08940 [Lewinellaceae bacterium]|nr:hypothetical protein [Lewinellaceae bacterium]